MHYSNMAEERLKYILVDVYYTYDDKVNKQYLLRPTIFLVFGGEMFQLYHFVVSCENIYWKKVG